MNEIKNLIHNFSIKNDRDFSWQLEKRDILKYEIHIFTIHYMKGKQHQHTNLPGAKNYYEGNKRFSE